MMHASRLLEASLVVLLTVAGWLHSPQALRTSRTRAGSELQLQTEADRLLTSGLSLCGQKWGQREGRGPGTRDNKHPLQQGKDADHYRSLDAVRKLGGLLQRQAQVPRSQEIKPHRLA